MAEILHSSGWANLQDWGKKYVSWESRKQWGNKKFNLHMTEALQKESKGKKEENKRKRNLTLKGRILYTRNKTWELNTPEAIRKEL